MMKNEGCVAMPGKRHAMIIILINNKLLAKRSYVSARHDTKTVDRYYRRPGKWHGAYFFYWSGTPHCLHSLYGVCNSDTSLVSI